MELKMIEMNNLYFWIDSVFGFFIVGLAVAIYSELKNGNRHKTVK